MIPAGKVRARGRTERSVSDTQGRSRLPTGFAEHDPPNPWNCQASHRFSTDGKKAQNWLVLVILHNILIQLHAVLLIVQPTTFSRYTSPPNASNAPIWAGGVQSTVANLYPTAVFYDCVALWKVGGGSAHRCITQSSSGTHSGDFR